MPSITNHDKRKLFYGNNLAVLRNYIYDQSLDLIYLDLIYLDPPFNSSQDYNVLFSEAMQGDKLNPFDSLQKSGTACPTK